MRAFLIVSGVLAGLVIALFLIADGAGPMPELEPRLEAGEALQGAEAQRAFTAWLAALPAAPAMPLRARYEGELEIEAPPDGPVPPLTRFHLDVAFADPRRGRVVLTVQAPAAGREPDVFGVLADGARMVFWMRKHGAEGERKAAYAVEQALAEEIWSQLRGNLGPLLQLAGAGEGLQAEDLPEQPLLFLHPGAWTARALRNWSCSSLVLEDGVLRSVLRVRAEEAGGAGFLDVLGPAGAGLPEALAIARGLGVEADFDARTGVWTGVRVAGAAPPSADVGARAALRVRAVEFARRAHDELLQLPPGVEPEDLTERARLLAPMLQAAAQAGPREF